MKNVLITSTSNKKHLEKQVTEREENRKKSCKRRLFPISEPRSTKRKSPMSSSLESNYNFSIHNSSSDDEFLLSSENSDSSESSIVLNYLKQAVLLLLRYRATLMTAFGSI